MSVHATCIVLREAGILIRGLSGAGKSTLARALILAGEAEGRFARLVSDDRVRIERRGGRLIASPHPAIAGLLEIRGIGLVAVAHEQACVLRLVVDLVDTPPPRLLESALDEVELRGVTLPRLATRVDAATSTILWRLRDEDDTVVTDR